MLGIDTAMRGQANAPAELGLPLKSWLGRLTHGDWAQRLHAHSSARVAAPPIGGRGAKRLLPLEPARGRYLRET